MDFNQTFYTGEAIDVTLKNLKVKPLRRLCRENITDTTRQQLNSRSNLYDIVATAPREAQDSIQ